MSATKDETLGAILLTLASRLTDDMLRDFFPELPPHAIRERLNAAATTCSSKRGGTKATKGGPSAESSPAPSMVTCQRLTIFTDGASRGNPGEAGAGGILIDEHGQFVSAIEKYLGLCTNNVAEYQALVLSLKEAKRLGAKQIAIKADSELLVRQVQGSYKVRNENLKPLYHEVMELLKGFERYEISHIRREYNTQADRLANQAIDNKT